jgi:hypothetical protein
MSVSFAKKLQLEGPGEQCRAQSNDKMIVSGFKKSPKFIFALSDYVFMTRLRLSWSQSFDFELQRQRCKNLQRNE